MVTKIKVTYSEQGSIQEMNMYVGKPKDDSPHPLHYQNKWLESTKNASVSKDLMDSIAKLYTLAKKNNADFEELLSYALESSSINEKNGLGLKKKVDLTKSAEEFLKKYESHSSQENKTFVQKEEEKKKTESSYNENQNIKEDNQKSSIYTEDADLFDTSINIKNQNSNPKNESKKNENLSNSNVYTGDEDLL